MSYTLEVIDRITKTFTDYIDSGFGLLQPDVAYLTTVLVTIDIILTGLYRALMNDQYMPVTLIQKTLYIGFFAFILNNFQELANLIYLSFAHLGVKAGQATFSADMLLKPAFIAETGMKTGGELIEQAGEQFFSWRFNSAKLSAIILLFAGIFVIIAFLILSVHLFIAIIEFKLTTLIGFILVPFALFGKTTFLADRVLNNVVNSGLKLMILGVITGIGSSIFKTLSLSKTDISLEEAASAVLASLAILTLAYSISALAHAMVLASPMLGATQAFQAMDTTRNTATTIVKGAKSATRSATDVTGPLWDKARPSNRQNQGGLTQTEQSGSGTQSASDLSSSDTPRKPL